MFAGYVSQENEKNSCWLLWIRCPIITAEPGLRWIALAQHLLVVQLEDCWVVRNHVVVF